MLQVTENDLGLYNLKFCITALCHGAYYIIKVVN